MVLKNILASFIACSIAIACFVSCNSQDNQDNKDNNNNNSKSDSTVSDVQDDINDTKNNIEDGLNNAKDNVKDAVDDTKDKVKSETDKMFDNSSDKSKDEGSLDFPTVANVNSLSTQKQGWGQGKNKDENNIPVSCTQFQNKYGHLDALFIEKNSKDIYLTFDEGYENGYTTKILDVLKEKNCPAVFFVTMPYVKENPDLIKRMIDEGHVVGNHTVNHPSMPEISIEKATNEIKELHDYVKENFNYEMNLFRPPMGEFSEQSLALTQSLGYKSVFWSYAYKDWDTKNQPEPKSSLELLTTSAHNGAIYLLHSVSKTNTEILSDFIDNLRANGYNFAKMQ